jgi:hypothetical protein
MLSQPPHPAQRLIKHCDEKAREDETDERSQADDFMDAQME